MQTNLTILVGEFLFPSDYASSLRVLNMAKAIKLIGENPVIAGRSLSNETFGEFESISFKNLDSIDSLTSKSSSKSGQYLNLLDKMHKLQGVKSIILYASSSYRFIPMLRKWCTSNGVNFYIDVSEYYSARQFKHGYLSLHYYYFTYSFKRKFKLADVAFTCSDVATDYFKAKKMNAITINAIMDLRFPITSQRKSEKINLVYAGDAGKKDNLFLFLKALSKLSENDLKKIQLTLVGPSQSSIDNILSKIPSSNKFANSLNIVGRVSREEVLHHLNNSHASILLRPNLRYSRFGFPSKVAESLSMGVPILGNITSDMDKYVIDNETGFVVKELTVDSIVDSIVSLISKSESELLEMRHRCIKMSKAFDYITLSSNSKFIKVIRNEKN